MNVEHFLSWDVILVIIFVVALFGLKIAKHAAPLGLAMGISLVGAAAYFAIAAWPIVSALSWIGFLIYGILLLPIFFALQIGLLMIRVAFRVLRGEDVDDIEDTLIGNFKRALRRE